MTLRSIREPLRGDMAIDTGREYEDTRNMNRYEEAKRCEKAKRRSDANMACREGQTEPGPEWALITIPAGNLLPTCMGNHYRPERGTLGPVGGEDDKPVGGPPYRSGITRYRPRGKPPAQAKRSVDMGQCCG